MTEMYDTGALGCRRACTLAYSSGNGVNDCSNLGNTPNFADHCEAKTETTFYGSSFDICRYKPGTLTGTCTVIEGPKKCSDFNESSSCFYAVCQFNASGCFDYDSPDEKKKAEAEVAWQVEIDRCNTFTNASACFDGNCKTNSTGCFPYSSEAEEAAAKDFAAKMILCPKITTENECFAAGCDFDSINTTCSAYTCGQQGTLSTDKGATVVHVTGPHWFGANGLKCALEQEPVGGTEELRVQVNANVADEYIQPASSTGICLRSVGSTHACSGNHSAVVNPLFNRLVVAGVLHAITGARPRLSGKMKLFLLLLCIRLVESWSNLLLACFSPFF